MNKTAYFLVMIVGEEHRMCTLSDHELDLLFTLDSDEPCGDQLVGYICSWIWSECPELDRNANVKAFVINDKGEIIYR